MDKKRKISADEFQSEETQFEIDSPEGSKYVIRGPVGFITVSNGKVSKSFEEITFDNAKLLEVLQVLGFNFNKD